MKKLLYVTLAVLCLAGCGRTKTESVTEADKRSFDAWVYVQKELHPEYLWKQTRLGSWLLEETPGTGDTFTSDGDTCYVRMNYVYRSLDGTIVRNSYEKIAQQLGTYKESTYYGPGLYYVGGIYAGFEDLLDGMRDGGRRKAAIPSWLLTYARYDDGATYLNDSTTTSHGIFELEMVEHFRDVKQWELDSIARYRMRNFPTRTPSDKRQAIADSTGTFGLYYIRQKAPTSAVTFKDTTAYINYTGRLLNGRVFDTTVRDTAMVHGVYSSDKSYGPVSIKFGSNWSDVKMGSSETSVIQGFARTLAMMAPFEKGTAIFWSPIGYSTSGSGSSIPGYSPLQFDIEFVKNPN